MPIQAKFLSRFIPFVFRSLTVATLASLVAQIPAQAQTTFSDVPSDYWAAQFIQALVDRGVIRGFADGSFRPNDPITRAQFAVLVDQAFDQSTVRSAVRFRDVPSSYWAASAIQTAYAEGFLSGYPGNVFNPAQPMPRAQVLVALASGLQFKPSGTNASVTGAFRDYNSIPFYADDGVAATFRNLTVNYPNIDFLEPNRAATRAEVAASIYQGLVATGRAPAIESPYIY
ncbi:MULTISPECIES: S-layer homology domain-containing protein [Cyanophyceae]|uniref:S-layer homology domain-containing protein n=1 Tax=Cyanophyceae TaxID=3028117 RepID=UPI00168857F3|nr:MULTISPECIES: S-layer homology domain-containing protein [Cyanophyceae]MBD1917976.1 S-layer homology domain-containing protein [Phormidium sp. FACHB-77]MBD2029224.1 S-layer homology domain-containing protein [Phormidium sp. FACHB-322]MBD2049756.1 S-layer homology domain-containing protein [Leptolyngbya sp. FACHB-60]